MPPSTNAPWSTDRGAFFVIQWILSDAETAERVVRSVRLLRASELLELCPGASLYRERVLGLTKSLMVYGGWENAGEPAEFKPREARSAVRALRGSKS